MADGRSVRDYARDHTEDAVKALVKVLGGGDGVPASAIVSAATALLDRGWGRPSQEFEAGDNLLGMLADIIAERRVKVSELNNGNEA